MNQTVYEKGIKKGQIELVLKMLKKRFGAVPEGVRVRIEAKSEDELQDLALQIANADSLQELGLAD